MTQVEILKEKVLAGETVTPEMVTTAQARDQLAEFESQRVKRELDTEAVERQRNRLDQARQQFENIVGNTAQIESLRQAIANAVEKYGAAVVSHNNELLEVNGVFADAGKSPVTGLNAPFRFGADNNGSVTINGQSLMPIRIDEEINNTVALAVGRQVKNYQPALGVPSDWIAAKGEKR